MKPNRTLSSIILLTLFCCYYSSISLFGHAHISGGVSVVHSHLGGNYEHSHSESQFAVIDILSQFQSESAMEYNDAPVPFYLLTDIVTLYSSTVHADYVHDVNTLRGPPQGC